MRFRQNGCGWAISFHFHPQLAAAAEIFLNMEHTVHISISYKLQHAMIATLEAWVSGRQFWFWFVGVEKIMGWVIYIYI